MHWTDLMQYCSICFHFYLSHQCADYKLWCQPQTVCAFMTSPKLDAQELLWTAGSLVPLSVLKKSGTCSPFLPCWMIMSVMVFGLPCSTMVIKRIDLLVLCVNALNGVKQQTLLGE